MYQIFYRMDNEHITLHTAQMDEILILTNFKREFLFTKLQICFYFILKHCNQIGIDYFVEYTHIKRKQNNNQLMNK